MTRLDVVAQDTVADDAEIEPGADADGPRLVVFESRDVPLGGVRAMQVHRALPQRDLPLIGAWCFLDRFGPQDARMRVEPHPHIGLQTVTWPFTGEVRHRDAVGSDVVIRPGQLNLMTSGEGIAHSEYSVGDDPVPLDALQLWVALPDSRRHGPPAFEQHADLPDVRLPAEEGPDATATVVLGSFAGIRSPATAYTPIVGAEIRLPPGTRIRLPLNPAWEYGILAVEGETVATTGDASEAITPHRLLYLGVDRDAVEVRSTAGATLFLLGGEPFEDDIVMWWNFVGRSHDEIVRARDAWEQQAPRFGRVVGHGDERVPAPPLPAVRLVRRQRRI